MKCLLKYQWVKLPRNQLPPGKGIMGAWARIGLPCSLQDWAGPVLRLHQQSERRRLGRRHRRPEEHPGDQTSAAGP